MIAQTQILQDAVVSENIVPELLDSRLILEHGICL